MAGLCESVGGGGVGVAAAFWRCLPRGEATPAWQSSRNAAAAHRKMELCHLSTRTGFWMADAIHCNEEQHKGGKS